jgi:hypothetical protein
MPNKIGYHRRKFITLAEIEGKRLVHICFNAQEHDRLTEAIIQDQPAKIYWFQDHHDINLTSYQENRKLIQTNSPKSEIVERKTDYGNYYAIMGDLVAIIVEERRTSNTKILLNAGLGSKMVAAANADIWRMFSEDVLLFYPYSEDYNPEHGKDAHCGLIKEAHPPELQYHMPPLEILIAIQILYYLKYRDAHGRTKDFVYKTEFDEWIQIACDKRKTPTMKLNPRNFNTRILLMQLKSEKWHLITVGTTNGTPVRFTPEGWNLARAIRKIDFGIPYAFKLPDDDADSFLRDDGIFFERNNDSKKRKIHLIFNMREKDRFLDPLIWDQPDVVYYLHMENAKREKDIYEDWCEKNRQFIHQKVPSCQIIHEGIDYLDYYIIISKIAKIISIEKQKGPVRIAINLGSGAKMCTIASMDAYRLWPDEIVPYYLSSKDYDLKDKSRPAHLPPWLISDVGRFPLVKISIEEIQAFIVLFNLFDLSNNEGEELMTMQSKWSHELIRRNLIQSAAKDNSRSFQASISRRVTNRFALPLESWGLIKVKSTGKDHRITITELGQKMFRVFRNYDYNIQLDSSLMNL